MKFREIYEFVIKKGIETDPRTKKEIKDELSRIRREYGKLGRIDKKYFDQEKLKHPFSDTRMLYGNSKINVRTVMVGIDVGGEELLVAQSLNEKGAGIDLAIGHHPSGKALCGLDQVMHVQTDVLVKQGLDRNVAKSLMKDRIAEVSRRVSSSNHDRSVDIAKLLDIPLMCVHTPADNHVVHFLKELFAKKKPKKVVDVLTILKLIPEYQDAMGKGVGPNLISGKEKNKTGKILIDMTGGTEGSKRIFARLSQAGVGTIIAMHFSEEHYKMAKAEFMNVIIAGHIASDNLGLNLLLDKLVKKSDINIIPCSGFVRFCR